MPLLRLSLFIFCFFIAGPLWAQTIQTTTALKLSPQDISNQVVAKYSLSDNSYRGLINIKNKLKDMPAELASLSLKTSSDTLKLQLYLSMLNQQTDEYVLSGIINNDITSYVSIHYKKGLITGSLGLKALQYDITNKDKLMILCELKRPLPRLSKRDILPEQLSFAADKEEPKDKPEPQASALKNTSGLFYNPESEVHNKNLFPHLGQHSKLVYKTIYIYYSKPTLKKYGMQGIESLTAQAMTDLNEILKRSGTHLRLNLIGTRIMSPIVRIAAYADQPSFYALAKFSLYLRSQHINKKADFMAYMVSKPSRKVTGIAYINGRYSITAAPHAIHNHTFAHELGHNFGLDHNEEKSTEQEFISRLGKGLTNFIGYLVRLVPLKNYGRGFSGDKNDSIMSYGPMRVPFFSNPGLTFNNEPLGITDRADAVKAINQKYTP